MNTKSAIPHIAIHPGFFLKEELVSREISQSEFAHDIDMPKTMLSEIINEKRSVTPEIALNFEKVLGIPAKFWLDFQSSYDIDKVRIREKNKCKNNEIELWQMIKQFVPVNLLTKRKILGNSLSSNITKVWEIFGVQSVEMLGSMYENHTSLSFYKKSEKLRNDEKNIFAWSKLAQWQVKSEVVGRFVPENMNEVVAELKALFLLNSDVINNTKRILSKHGIKFLIVEKLNQSPIDGYSFWSGDNPAIVLTLRKKNLDNFAFAVLHELGHVYLHIYPNHSEDFLDVDCADLETSIKEDEANSFASQQFIDEKIWANFLADNPKFEYKGQSTERKLNQLAQTFGLPQCIVWGRYKHDTKQYKIRGQILSTIQ